MEIKDLLFPILSLYTKEWFHCIIIDKIRSLFYALVLQQLLEINLDNQRNHIPQCSLEFLETT